MLGTGLRKVVIVCAVGVAPLAHAVSASATAENLRFSVIDLYPDDGIAPSVVFSSWNIQLSGSVVGGFVGGFRENLGLESGHNGPDTQVPISDLLPIGLQGVEGTAGVNVGVKDGFPTGSLFANGSTSQAPRNFEFSVLADWFVHLGPGTEMTFQLDAEVDTAQPGLCVEHWRCTNVGLFSFIPGTVPPGGATRDILYGGSDARTLSASYANVGNDGTIPVFLNITLRALGEQAAPIPEPATWATMLLGVAAVATSRWWRRRGELRKTG